jgi:prepilin-type N-terminal cleavage/methylation domain-containing protein
MDLKTKSVRRVDFKHFSLVELLVVCAIIAILLGIGAGGYTVVRRRMAQARTEAILNKLKVAIESYKNKYGYYPQPHVSASDPAVEFHLDINSFTSGQPQTYPNNNLNQFLDYSKMQRDECEKINGIYYVKDGFNAPTSTVGGKEYSAIMYRCPGIINKTSFDIYSAGPDRKFASDPASSTEDDIYSQ